MKKSPTTKGPARAFQGDVWAEVLFEGQDSPRLCASNVRFAPGARTAWHSHALGQLLHVTEGTGLVQSRGGAVVTVHAGDLIYTPAGEWHWHGAAPDSFMSHVAIKVGLPAGSHEDEVIWGEHVEDAECRGSSGEY